MQVGEICLLVRNFIHLFHNDVTIVLSPGACYSLNVMKAAKKFPKNKQTTDQEVKYEAWNLFVHKEPH